VTVAVLPEPEEHEFRIDPRDLDESFTRGTGKGGQHRNKTDSCVVLIHRPSGTKVRIDGGRSQHVNRQTALTILRTRLKAEQDTKKAQRRNTHRKAQVSSGARGDKRRTVAVQRNQVVDHRTGRRITWETYQRGNLRRLWPASCWTLQTTHEDSS
jgi:peptide chain release factor 1